MKKWISALFAVVLVLALAACGGNNNADGGKKEGKLTKLVVGASNVPHAEILEKAQPILKEKGIDLKIVKFQDYVLPNKALADKEIDANYFQHIPYLEAQKKEHGYDFVNAGGIHIEPIGLYSKKYKSLEELPDGATIIMSNSVADHGRILSMLQEKGLIKLKEGIDKTKATVKDIVENPKHLKFEADVEAGLLPQIYKNGEGDAVLINANYALDAGLDPAKDPIAVESPKDNPYVNIIAVRKGDENRKEIKTLVEVLQSKEIQDFIKEKYKGAVIPAAQ
ncbi:MULTISPECIES: MetQ/NlpA family ABC transporter substrate-binding protein [Bacillaceae]|jgi:D-methionine transport system substrate-binding protein|uniref:MetQ/NlpA family ABC transporter substrate-binding protein n=1 Tax=Anoxybacillaceae TaxID=3120669 RepID=UPI000BE382CD|nr:MULTISPECIES: MetQ/NlpA family ABC transporter substrate-binding protein [Bacillaceae]PDM39110.1 methionine ABC transporter substrate-binding protein [Parageobacillus yumthangensis]TXK90033.1 ABC transporter substrate-binding protein [Parageobacillus sp. SY1]PUF87683.1 ABC transporter substrate-binding protein [Geobacillus sp. LYN3]RDV21858.1 ABC transporter substrate-binding protein [Parageobacillus toebii]TXK87560.1 ABC transporter substrate-binding protein [Geobacillus sp. AYS3]